MSCYRSFLMACFLILAVLCAKEACHLQPNYDGKIQVNAYKCAHTFTHPHIHTGLTHPHIHTGLTPTHSHWAHTHTFTLGSHPHIHNLLHLHSSPQTWPEFLHMSMIEVVKHHLQLGQLIQAGVVWTRHRVRSFTLSVWTVLHAFFIA